MCSNNLLRPSPAISPACHRTLSTQQGFGPLFPGSEFIISCSYLEIYKEVVRDLLQPHGAGAKAGGLSIREGSSKSCKGVFVEGLSQVYVTSEADVLECLECGNANRIIGSTLMNAQSSRSHALLTLTLRQQLSDGTVRVSKLNVADLAGSEKVSKTGAKGETLEEAKKINTSLSALCLVISALADARPHVRLPKATSEVACRNRTMDPAWFRSEPVVLGPLTECRCHTATQSSPESFKSLSAATPRHYCWWPARLQRTTSQKRSPRCSLLRVRKQYVTPQW